MAYDTDLTDEQWQLVEPYIPPAKPGGRRRHTSMRRTVDALFYILKTGCQWRLLPADFPPWQTVFGYFKVWGAKAVLRRLHQVFYAQVRIKEGRKPSPSAAIIDSQTVKTGKMGGPRGYDGNKKTKGRKRHLVVDTEGLMLASRVTAANKHDTKGGILALLSVEKFLVVPQILTVFADKAYQGSLFASFVHSQFDGATVQIGENNTSKIAGFVPDRLRWKVERTFAWFYDHRRLTMDYERTFAHSRAMMRLFGIRQLLRRLTTGIRTAW